MDKYPIPMVPGPVYVPEKILQTYQVNYASADLEKEFISLYLRVQEKIRTIVKTKNSIAIQTGEGMLALWGGLKSVVQPEDRVLCIATGVFGYGIADMAKMIGANVRVIGFPYNETLSDLKKVEEAIIDFKPKMITVVHCETPSGTLNPIARLGALKHKYHVPLLYLDAVSSIGGVPVLTDEWHVDLLLGGSQKVLSMPPDMCFTVISQNAWKVIKQVGYAGYDALLPFCTAIPDAYFPYTPNWHGFAAMEMALDLIFKEGLEKVFIRHRESMEFCHNRLRQMGLQLFPAQGSIPSPTVTAVYVPEKIKWPEFDARLREQGLCVAGSYGPLAGRVFRIGHMGSQANLPLLGKALNVIEKVLGGNA